MILTLADLVARIGGRRRSWRTPTLAAFMMVAFMMVAVLVMPSRASSQDDTTTDQATEVGGTDEADEPPVSTDPLTAGSLTLLGQSHYVAADGDFVVRLGWDGPVDADLVVATTIRGKINSESQLGADTSVLNRPPIVPLVTVREPDGSLLIEVPIRSFPQSVGDPPDRILIPDPGVYPVIIEIRDSFGTVASLRTYLIRLPTETAEIDLQAMAVILPVSSADGLTIEDVITLLDRHPTLPATVHLETGVVSELIEDPASALALNIALRDRTLIVGSSLDLDPSALAEIGQGHLYGQAIESSRAVLVDLGLDPSTSTLPIEPALTVEGAELLRDLGVSTVFDAETGLSGIVMTPSGPLRVTGVDEELTSLLTSGSDAVAAAHRLIALLALRAETDTTPILIGGPTLRQASLDAIDVIMTAQEMVGLLEPVSLEEFSELSPPLTLRTVENPTQDLVPVSDLISESLGLIESYRSFHASGDPSPQTFENGLYAALGRDRNPGDRRRAIEQVDAQIRDAFGVVTIRDGQSMTLTARELLVPLSVESSASGDRMIELRFTGDKVAVKEDGQVFVIPPGQTTLDITVEARALGLSPLDVQAFSPDGQQVLSSTRLQIRSTAVPGLGLLLSGAALAFLISWWIVSIGRTRAQRHTAALDADAAAVGVNVDADGPTRTI